MICFFYHGDFSKTRSFGKKEKIGQDDENKKARIVDHESGFSHIGLKTISLHLLQGI